MDSFLASDDVIDGDHPVVAACAHELRASHPSDDDAFADAAFAYVRDGIAHSVDVQDRRVVVSASDTLREGVGLCFNKAHLLVALLRAGGVPAGLCYQRLADGEGFVVHGLIAVRTATGWERRDPRGGDAPFTADPARGEVDYETVYAAAHPAVLAALRGAQDMLELCAKDLPQELT